MQFLTDVLVAVLTAYLAFTNTLADNVASILPENQIENTFAIIQEITTPDPPSSDPPSLSQLPSEYESGGPIPDILIKNASYQSASVIDSLRTNEPSISSIPEALVNIYCTYKTDSYVRTNTGTGFFIDPEGVIMTNAHVAQFLLLETVNKKGETRCIVRGGNPAQPLYEAELLYISPAWIQKNAQLITNRQPRGTGERDFALLYVTAGVDNKPMPSKFPYLNIDTSLLTTNMMGSEVTTAGYPAEGLIVGGVDTELAPVIATTTLTDMFTFVSQFADVMSIGETPVGEFGASGGPVLNDKGNVIGLITTKGSQDITNHSLRALTLSYIDRTIIEESTFDLKRTMSGKFAFRAQLFTETIVPFLSKILESELE